MRVIVPYTLLNPLVEGLLKLNAKDEGYTINFIQMLDTDHYWRLLCEIWENREEVVIIEHDIIPWPGCITELTDCPFDWCSNSYRMKKGYGIHHAFGCTKLGVSLMERMPDVWSQVDDTRWNTLDAQLCELAKREGITPHPHRPPVNHLKGLYEADTVAPCQQEIWERITNIQQGNEAYLVKGASELSV
jgi:hypothetical protein